MTQHAHPARPLLAASLLPLCFSLLLAGCGGGGGSSAAPALVDDEDPAPPAAATVSLRIVPSLGKTFAADVRVIAPGGGGLEVAELARNKTGSGGDAEVEVPEDSEGPFIVEVSGNDDATYYDEGSDATVELGSDDVMRTIVTELPADGSGIAVTPLTEMACRYLEAEHGPLSLLSRTQLAELVNSGQVAAAFDRVREELAPELGGAGINALPALIGSAADLAALGNSDADLYALKLAALARVAHRNGAERPALAMMKKLADDLADGSVNGMRGLDALGTDTYDVNLLAQQLRNAAQELATSPQLEAALASLEQYVSAFLIALGQVTAPPEDGGGGPLPIVPGDLLASWAGNYHGNWNVETLEAKIYVWPFGWQRDALTELAMQTSMDLLTFNGNACNWVITPENLTLGSVTIPFSAAFAAAAVGDARSYTLPTSLTVLGFGITGSTTVQTQGLLPTHAELSYHYKGLVKELTYAGSCSFSYVL